MFAFCMISAIPGSEAFASLLGRIFSQGSITDFLNVLI
jgi:hypothetical protein